MKLKHLFSLTLLLLFGGTVMAKKVTADLSQGVLRGGNATWTQVNYAKASAVSTTQALVFDAEGKAKIELSAIIASDKVTYDEEKHSITSTGEIGSYMEIQFDKAYDFSNVESGKVTFTGDDIGSHLEFVGSGHDGFWASKYAPLFAGEIAKGNYQAVTGIKLYFETTYENDGVTVADENKGTMTLTGISLTAKPAKLIDGHDTPIEKLTHYVLDKDGTFKAGSPIATYYNNTTTDIIIGDGEGNQDEYIDLDGYDELRIYTDDELARVFFYYEENNEKKSLTNLYVNNNILWTSNTHEKAFYNKGDGYYYAKIADIKEKLNGHAKVIGAKSLNKDATASKIIVYKADPDYDFVLTGQYSPKVPLEPLYTSDARAVDCTGFTGDDVEIYSQNPNCIFVAKKEGVLKRSNNIAVNNTISNFVLTDGQSLKVPTILTATNATYTRNMTTTYGTVVLPYEVKANSNVTFFTIYAMDANSITLTEAPTLAAGTPAIIKKLTSEENVTLAASGVEVSGTISNPTGAVTMYGSYTQGTKVTDENAYYIYNNKFYRRAQQTAEVTDPHFICNAFRAYFVPGLGEGGSADVLSLRVLPAEPTAVEATAVNALNSIQEIYNTAGVRLPELRKGVNIVRLADGKTITVTVK